MLPHGIPFIAKAFGGFTSSIFAANEMPPSSHVISCTLQCSRLSSAIVCAQLLSPTSVAFPRRARSVQPARLYLIYAAGGRVGPFPIMRLRSKRNLFAQTHRPDHGPGRSACIAAARHISTLTSRQRREVIIFLLVARTEKPRSSWWRVIPCSQSPVRASEHVAREFAFFVDLPGQVGNF